MLLLHALDLVFYIDYISVLIIVHNMHYVQD